MHTVFDAVPREINIHIQKTYEKFHPLVREQLELKPTKSDGNAHIFIGLRS